MPAYHQNDEVSWKTGRGVVRGRVKEIHTSRIDKDEAKARNASEDNPTYVIERDDGSEDLKSESELYMTDEPKEGRRSKPFEGEGASQAGGQAGGRAGGRAGGQAGGQAGGPAGGPAGGQAGGQARYE